MVEYGDWRSIIALSNNFSSYSPQGDVFYIFVKNYTISCKTGHLPITTIHGNSFKMNLGKTSTDISIQGFVPFSILEDIKNFLDQSLFVTSTRKAIPLYLWIKDKNGIYQKFRKENSDDTNRYLKVNVDGYSYKVENNSMVVNISINCSFAGTVL